MLLDSRGPGARPTTLVVQSAVIDARPTALDVRPATFDVRPAMVVARPAMFGLNAGTLLPMLRLGVRMMACGAAGPASTSASTDSSATRGPSRLEATCT